jgi:tetratricopeptide (TPR) repeat protein
LEFLDTDFIVTNGQKTVQSTTAGAAPTVTYWAKGVGNVKAGFRIYDPIRKQIAYQNGYRYSNNWESSASNATEALNRLIGKDIATKQISYSAGQDFGLKVVPSTTWEARTMMKGKSPIMQQGGRAARVNDWDQAIASWLKAVEGYPEERGAAAYNLAFAYEVTGQLEEAKKWCATSYREYGFKKARDYAAVIDRRIADEARLQEQLR